MLPDQKIIEKIRKDERKRVYDALVALEILNYSIPEEFYFIKIGDAVISIDKWIESWEESKKSSGFR